jgi:hypothetical protein
MKKFAQAEVEKIVTDLLLVISIDNDGSPKLANESIEIINNTEDNYVFSGIVMTKIRPSIFNEREENLKIDVMSYLQVIFDLFAEDKRNDGEFNSDLSKIFHYDNLTESYNSKMEFALSQFANSFYAYDNLEKKYPELMKFI